ncbi:MAG: CoA transferase [Burkholderiaceae bacterium]
MTWPYPTYWSRFNRENAYGYDPEIARTYNAGMPGLWLQDAACQSGVSAIYDRSHEHLGTSDTGIVRTAACCSMPSKLTREDQRPPSVGATDQFLWRAISITVPTDGDWMQSGREFMRAGPGRTSAINPETAATMTESEASPFARRAAEFPAHEPRPVGAPTALQGLRVVDFTHFIAGPMATMILADMGADVIKVEAPERGDELRYYPPAVPGLESQGGPFVWSNRNKRSVALDLKSPTGLELARRLVAQADVVVENFSTGVMQRFGLDYDNCRALNPRLIYVPISAYGREARSRTGSASTPWCRPKAASCP